MLKQQLQQKLQQRLSPQQIQQAKLLELSSLELEERVWRELEENPALEEGKDTNSADETDDTFEAQSDRDIDLTLGDYLTEDDIPPYKLREISERAQQREEIPFADEQSLGEQLNEQLSLIGFSAEEFQIAQYIVGSLDDDGYLRRSLQQISDDLLFQVSIDAPIADLEHILQRIQRIEPAGIAARTLQECLLLQLTRQEDSSTKELSIKLLSDHFDEFSHKHFDKIQHLLSIDEQTLKSVMQHITQLNPKPGATLGGELSDKLSVITPDFVVETMGDELVLSMNGAIIPSMRISREYASMLKDYDIEKAKPSSASDREAMRFVRQKLEDAQWFIDAVRQRQETLNNTMSTIVALQHDFFLTGEDIDLRPMILKDIADRTGYDISTISRVTGSKYVQTTFGIFPLKHLFSESMLTESGEEISNKEIKVILQQAVDSESKKKPLTDEELTTLLRERGYVIARRTVAKYREQLDIPVARLRKEI